MEIVGQVIMVTANKDLYITVPLTIFPALLWYDYDDAVKSNEMLV